MIPLHLYTTCHCCLLEKKK